MHSRSLNLARIAGAFYSITFIAGLAALVLRVGPIAAAAGLVAAVSYVAVTALFYFLFAPANQFVSLVACGVSLAGVEDAAGSRERRRRPTHWRGVVNSACIP